MEINAQIEAPRGGEILYSSPLSCCFRKQGGELTLQCYYETDITLPVISLRTCSSINVLLLFSLTRGKLHDNAIIM